MENNAYLKWLTQDTPTVWWNDSAILAEQEQAYANGATGMTTNPVLVNGALAGDRDMWKEKTSGLDKTLTGDAKALAAIHSVTGFYARKSMPIFIKGNVGEGYVCAQVNPNFHGNSEYMVEQAKVLASWSPNIVVKLPATAAGIRAFEQCVALGLNVASGFGEFYRATGPCCGGSQGERQENGGEKWRKTGSVTCRYNGGQAGRLSSRRGKRQCAVNSGKRHNSSRDRLHEKSVQDFPKQGVRHVPYAGGLPWRLPCHQPCRRHPDYVNRPVHSKSAGQRNGPVHSADR
ncbi:MAG: transaldolase family protein [Planctomycetaceae bacterium]|nr:transaldolase family protein [Planctomycetaceae bacterium]